MRGFTVLSINVVAISMCNVRKIASLYLPNAPTNTLDYIKTFCVVSGFAQQNNRLWHVHQHKANTLIYTRWQHLMDIIHQSGMGRGGSTLPPEQLSRISPTHFCNVDLMKLFQKGPVVGLFLNEHLHLINRWQHCHSQTSKKIFHCYYGYTFHRHKGY